MNNMHSTEYLRIKTLDVNNYVLKNILFINFESDIDLIMNNKNYCLNKCITSRREFDVNEKLCLKECIDFLNQ